MMFQGTKRGTERIRNVAYALSATRKAYVHVARGKIKLNGRQLRACDALKVSDEPTVVLEHGDQSEVLLFDLP